MPIYDICFNILTNSEPELFKIDIIMDTQTILIIAQLFGNLAITVGIIIAIVQVKQMKKQRKEMAAIEFFNAWLTPEFTKAVNEIQLLPNQITTKKLIASKPEMESYAFLVHSFFESTGILVNRKIISFNVVNDLVGGVIQVVWKKLEVWIKEWREERNPVAGEWFEWLKNEIESKSELCKKGFVKAKNTDLQKEKENE